MSDPRSKARTDSVRALRFHQRFHVRTTFFFGALALVLIGAMGWTSYRWTRDTELAALQARMRALAIALSQGVDAETVQASLAGDRSDVAYGRLVALFASIGEDERDIVSIYVLVPTERPGLMRFAADWVRNDTPPAADIGQLYDATQAERLTRALGGPEVEQEIYEDEWGATLSGYAPIRDESGNAVAVIGVDVTARRVARVEKRALASVSFAYGAALIVLVLTGLVLGRGVRRPIARIIEASAEIAAGTPGARVKLERDDELGVLARYVDRMAEGLEERERIRALFGRYVSEEVAQRALASPDAARLGGEEREVTVLFVDLARFAAISERLAPAKVVEVLEQYLSATTAVVEQHGGCVVEMLGDAILAVFGAPDAQPDHASCALRCAIAIEKRLVELNEEWTRTGEAERWSEHGVDRLRARIGVHTGRVVAGNTGGPARMKYAVIGDTVNVAARIEALNDALGTTLLVSAEVHARVGEELARIGEPKGEHRVKGRAQPVAVFAY